MQKNKKIKKVAFKAVQMKFLAMHITYQKLRFYIFTVGNLQNIFMEPALPPPALHCTVDIRDGSAQFVL